MPISIESFAPRDERKHKTLSVEGPGGQTFPVDVEFYINRLTMEPVRFEPGDEDAGEDEAGLISLRNAASLCDVLASWDVTGPLSNRKGEVVVPEHETVPLEPHIVRLVPIWFTSQLTEKLLDVAFPNRNGSRASRRR